MNHNLLQTDSLTMLKSLEKSSVDAILTDPPYAISRDTNFQSTEEKGDDTDRFRVSYEFGEWDTVDLEYFTEVFKEFYRVLKKGGNVVIFYDMWKVQEIREILEKIGFSKFRILRWEKTNPVPINRKSATLSNSTEYAIYCCKGKAKSVYNMYWYNEFLEGIGETKESLKNKAKTEKAITVPFYNQDRGIFNYPIAHRKNRFHTTEKPLKLMEDLVRIYSNEGDVILDPFLGSGTTAVAAKNLGRVAVGCEINPEYYVQLLDRFNSGEE